ncbi:MAG: hypothetical protein P1S46_09850, partial [bacterium]|nr:hypothetical protein [bacterium]
WLRMTNRSLPDHLKSGGWRPGGAEAGYISRSILIVMDVAWRRFLQILSPRLPEPECSFTRDPGQAIDSGSVSEKRDTLRI